MSTEKNKSEKSDNNWPRVRDLPEKERNEFEIWLNGQTRPVIEGEPDSEQDGYFPWDYAKWRIVKMGGAYIWD
jgi:hypothetical protein